VPRHDPRRYAAPAAFLLAVTIAVVLIRAGLHGGGTTTTAASATAPSATEVSGTTTTATRTTARKKRYVTVQAGDTFGSIAAKTGVSVATLQRLNPKLSSTSLFIGEKVRIG
jgi:LysM repeat protein